jgi:LEA14-like dessication related protein
MTRVTAAAARLGLVLPLVLLSLACSMVKRPTAKLNRMDVVDITPKGFTMSFDLDLANPNPVALPLADSEYALALGGTKVLEGKANPGGMLPANGSATIKLPVTITYENLLTARRAIVNASGTVPYALTGKIGVGGKGGLFGPSATVPLKYTGELNVKTLLKNPQALMDSPAAKKLAAELIVQSLSP